MNNQYWCSQGDRQALLYMIYNLMPKDFQLFYADKLYHIARSVSFGTTTTKILDPGKPTCKKVQITSTFCWTFRKMSHLKVQWWSYSSFAKLTFSIGLKTSPNVNYISFNMLEGLTWNLHDLIIGMFPLNALSNSWKVEFFLLGRMGYNIVQQTSSSKFMSRKTSALTKWVLQWTKRFCFGE